ncbi:glycoside hydrolase family 3 protein [Salipiger sp. IMCC34102]|uniref:glycoside hydrolase family 3 protein n=1 Tax=Salipiger sp. IMCC34102 TaxID=2510647 RepID=UPI00101D29B4|nr:glycoside hydrolase family 3 N-terminal domain-containing protein [Salipiger sp. IMCC34102]RYH02519.1 glycoside hydrolase family 3 protein [Salipiger sp. IMCC34102]
MQIDDLRAAPFGLDDVAIAWVLDTAAALEPAARIAQLFNIGLHGPAEGLAHRIGALQPGGITRFFSEDGAAEAGLLDDLQERSAVPLLVSADLEGSRMSLAFGTGVPNPLALAAGDDPDTTRKISRIMADEATAIGVNWSFTPVLDINAAFRSPIVATRGYGSDPATIRRHALAQLEVFQANGIAACVKHWPGEGYDDRDQHLVTTINPLDMEAWEASFGVLYRAAIDAGVLSVMSAHIALPAFVRELDPDAGIEAARPASLSRVLNEGLLRDRLGFNGLIVSDASEMAGVTSWMEAAAAKVEILRAGCDMVLFTDDLARDVANVQAAVADGTLSQARLEAALLRVLGLKAALGLHRRTKAAPIADRLARLNAPEACETAQAAYAAAPTLVKDVNGLFPITPERQRRVLFASTGIVSPLHGAPTPFALPDMMRARGFEVTEFAAGTPFDPTGFDLVLYAFGEETLLTRGRIFLDWLGLTGDFRYAMKRPWHQVPTAMVSFGYPYYLYDAPRVPAYVNAYATTEEMQAATLDCMTGAAPFRGRSPVDPFCGLEDARF